MNPTAKKCIWWAVGLIVIGSALMAFLPDLLARYFSLIWNDPAAAAAYGSVTLALSILRDAAMPVGGALIGSAVVINTIRPGSRDQEAAPADGPQI